MKKHLSVSQRIHNAIGSQAAENLHAEHTYLHAKAFSKEEWGTIWSKSDETSWGHAFGKWVGFSNIWYGDVASYDVNCYSRYKTNMESMPELAGMDPRPLSEMSIHTLVTDVIEVADDGLTARAFLLTPGLIAGNVSVGYRGRCSYLWERYGADFVFENGDWYFLHEQVCPDIMGSLDSGNWAYDDYQKLVNPQPMGGFPGGPGGPPPSGGGAPGAGGPPAGGGAPGGAPGAGGPPAGGGAPGAGGPPSGGGAPGGAPGGNSQRLQILGPLHAQYSTLQAIQNTVPTPKPYASMDNDNTYTESKTNFGRNK